MATQSWRCDYFASLMTDARAPRRSIAREAIAAKLDHLESERRQKLGDLEPRYTIRATVTQAAFLCARAPATRVRLRARRRKAEGEIVVVVPAEVRPPDRLACATCHRTTCARRSATTACTSSARPAARARKAARPAPPAAGSVDRGS